MVLIMALWYKWYKDRDFKKKIGLFSETPVDSRNIFNQKAKKLLIEMGFEYEIIIPIIDLNSFKLSSMISWMEENLANSYSDLDYGGNLYFLFKSEIDAVAFKLQWC